MNSNSTNITLIHKALKKYKQKYYLYKILQGLIISASLIGFLYLTIVLFQYFFYLPVNLKKFIFWGFIITSTLIFIEFVLLKILNLFNLLPTISKYKASNNISKHFPEIKDKLINVLELSNIKSDSKLLLASINQKIDDIKIFDFTKAVQFSNLKQYAKYIIFPLAILVFLLFYNKNILIEGNQKFVDYSVYYQPEAPFKFNLLTDKLTLQSGNDLPIKISITGDYIPDKVYVVFGNNKIPLIFDKNKKNVFTYTFKSINKNFDFYFSAQGFKSKIYNVKVLPSPNILNFTLNAKTPIYTNKKNITLKNSGDILVPYGTTLNYKFKVNSVDSLFMIFDSTIVSAKHQKEYFTVNKIAKKSTNYKIKVLNKYFNKEIFKYNLTVIPDMYPDIEIQTKKDSAIFSKYYFHGLISDDYGFTSLKFNYKVSSINQNETKNFKQIKLPINKNIGSQDFYYIFNFNDIKIPENKQVKYFFSISDNDPFLGPKTAKTQTFVFSLPTRSKIDSTVNEIDSKVQEQLDKANKLADEISLDISNFNQKMINEDLSDWEKQNFLDNLIQKQETLEKLVDSLKNQNKQKINNLEQLSEKNKELLEKQKKIQEMLEELLNDDIKKLLDSLRNMQKEFNEKEFDKLMDNTPKDYENLSKNLDKSYELMKRMEIEQQLQNLKDKAQQLSDNQKNMSKNIDKNNKLDDAKKDSILTDEFEFKKLKADYDSLLKKNKSLEKPFKLDSLDKEFDKIQEDFEKTKENMFKNKKNKTSDQLQKNSQDLQELSQKMNQMMQSNMQMQNAEDVRTIKFLLSNLLTFSFSQEDLLRTTKLNLIRRSKKYIQLKRDQVELTDDFKIIEDSLYALAKRNPIVGTVITNQLNNITENLTKTNKYLQKGIRNKAAISQQKVITSANKLALMLQESLQQMQNQMPGSGSSSNPSNQKMPSIGNMKQLQKSMQKQLQEMLNQMKNGKKPCSKCRGQQMARREAFQKMLQDMLNSDNISPEMKQLLEEMKRLNEDIKEDVINNTITPETLMRDKKITTRLLEAENAENKRKFSKKRKSNTSEDIQHKNPKDLENIFNNSFKHNDVFTKKFIKLNNFYNKYYNNYVHRLTNR